MAFEEKGAFTYADTCVPARKNFPRILEKPNPVANESSSLLYRICIFGSFAFQGFFIYQRSILWH